MLGFPSPAATAASRFAATPRGGPGLRRRASRQRGWLLLAALVGVGCGEDVLVARFGLTSNAPDAGVVEAAAFDAGTGSKFNSQSFNAERARRARERRVERAEHDADH